MNKKIIFSAISIIIFWTGVELFYRTFKQCDNLSLNSFSLRICGEILGCYDEKIFWRLDGIYPDFGKEGYRIICLADSVSVMYGGHKEYPAMLENLLNKSIPDKKIKVFNAGVPGYTSFQGYLYLKNELIRQKPNFVTLNFGPNDHSCALNGKADKEQRVGKSLLDKLFHRSRFYCCYKNWIKNVRLKYYKHNVDAGKSRVSMQDFEDNLISMIDLCRLNNCKVIMLTSFYLDKGQSWVETHKRYNDIITLVAVRRKVNLIDLAEQFSKRSDLFIDPEKDHVHINMKGYEIVARALYEVIRDYINAKEGV